MGAKTQLMNRDMKGYKCPFDKNLTPLTSPSKTGAKKFVRFKKVRAKIKTLESRGRINIGY